MATNETLQIVTAVGSGGLGSAVIYLLVQWRKELALFRTEMMDVIKAQYTMAADDRQHAMAEARADRNAYFKVADENGKVLAVLKDRLSKRAVG